VTTRGWGEPDPKSPGLESARPALKGANMDERTVSLPEGNEGRRDGRQGVGAPHSTDEAGELIQWTQWREGGVESWSCKRER